MAQKLVYCCDRLILTHLLNGVFNQAQAAWQPWNTNALQC